MVKEIKNFFKNISQKYNANTHISNNNKINITSSYASKQTLSNYKLFVENPYVRRSVTLLSSAISSIKFKLYKNSKYISDHKIYDILNSPNYNDSWSSFLEAFTANFIIYGNAYIFMDHINGNIQIHNLKSANMEVVAGSMGVPKSFIYKVDSVKHEYINGDNFPFIGHLKNYNPNDNWYGLSILDSISMSANLHQAITIHNLGLISNGGRPSGIISLKNRSQPLTDIEKQKILATVNDYTGANNAGKIMFIEGDFEWTPIGLGQKDMDYISAKTLAAREISEALGVPAILVGGVGLSSESARANYQEVVKRFNEGTVLPLAQKIFCFFNNWIVKKLDPECTLTIDLHNFLPLNDRKNELWDNVNSSSFLSDKEKRILLGLESVEQEVEVVRNT